jgi:RNA polymerase sigma factor (sigma-70 family)
MYLASERHALAQDRSRPARGGEEGSRAVPGLDELGLIYAFLYRRVGNREDAEDLTQEVALKGLPRLQEGRETAAIRGYLFATARSVLASFWARRLGRPEAELPEDLWLEEAEPVTTTAAADEVERVLGALPDRYRRLLDLRFLKGYSSKEAAAEMGVTLGAVKVMQLRALRAAAKLERPL